MALQREGALVVSGVTTNTPRQPQPHQSTLGYNVLTLIHTDSSTTALPELAGVRKLLFPMRGPFVG